MSEGNGSSKPNWQELHRDILEKVNEFLDVWDREADDPPPPDDLVQTFIALHESLHRMHEAFFRSELSP